MTEYEKELIANELISELHYLINRIAELVPNATFKTDCDSGRITWKEATSINSLMKEVSYINWYGYDVRTHEEQVDFLKKI